MKKKLIYLMNLVMTSTSVALLPIIISSLIMFLAHNVWIAIVGTILVYMLIIHVWYKKLSKEKVDKEEDNEV